MSINNVEELRAFMAEELQRLRNKESTPASANAAANIAGKIMNSVKMELEYNKMVGASPSIKFLKKLLPKIGDENE
jgi:hypothetical protein